MVPSESSRPLRVIHVITRLIVGGAQENTIASVLGLIRKPGADVHLISGPARGAEGSMEASFAALPHHLTILPDLVRPIHPWKDYFAFRRLARVFRERSPHLVHTHSGKAGIVGRLAAHHARVPHIVHTIHGPSFGSFQGVLPNQLFRAAERNAARFTTQFVSVAQAMTQQYLAAGIGHPDQYVTIRSGFALEPFLKSKNDPATRARFGIAPNDFVVGKIARLFKLKGHDDLFAAAPGLVQRCPSIKFLLVGDGPLRGRFQEKAKDLGLQSHFIFTGLVPPFEIAGLVGIMDALVHLSCREGLPRSLPQALAAGRPVVAYDSDGANEVCLENQTGFLVKPGKWETLTARLLQLAKDPLLRARLGRRGQELVAKSFSEEQMVEELYALYQKLLGTKPAVQDVSPQGRS